MLGLNLQQLEYLVAVDNYKQFTIAAEKCFVTQPTLSMQIKKAEEQLGIVIFDRSKQPVLSTPVGRFIINQARVVINEYNRLEEIVREQSGRIEGELNIGIILRWHPICYRDLSDTLEIRTRVSDKSR